MAERRDRIVGIDFGTSTTLVAERQGQAEPRVLPIGETTSWMPSVLGIDGARLVAGEDAVRLGPRRTISSIKSALTEGRDEVVTSFGTIDVREGVTALLEAAIRRAKAVDPDLLEGAEVFLGCPALWTGRERKLLVEVAHGCGIEVDIGQVIDEPVAAGLHWVNSQWLSDGQRPSGKSLIFDAGGGTLDVAYLDVAGIEHPLMTVMSAEGRAESGDKLDTSIFDHLRASIDHDRQDEAFAALLRGAARNLKEALSFQEEATVAVGAPYDAVVSLDRSTLNTLFAEQLARAVSLVRSSVRGSLLRVQQPESPVDIRRRGWADLASEVRHVALVGGLSYVPAVAEELRSLFPQSSVVLVDRPQESVVRGLVYGDSLDELNLPRPPVDFYVEYPGLEHRIDADWLAENELIYEAFSPLYSQADLMRGSSHLGFVGDIPNPPGVNGNFEFVIRCVIPDRERTPLTMQFKGPQGVQHGSGKGVRLEHDSSKRASLKLYTNGEFVVNSSRNVFKARVSKWPRLRGPNHDFSREIEIETGVVQESEYHRPFDSWRFQ